MNWIAVAYIAMNVFYTELVELSTDKKAFSSDLSLRLRGRLGSVFRFVLDTEPGHLSSS